MAKKSKEAARQADIARSRETAQSTLNQFLAQQLKGLGLSAKELDALGLAE